jgi:hypothetical protein
MPTRSELDQVVDIQRENLELKAEIAQIEGRLQVNYQRMIRGFFPYLLSIYAGWRPRIGETAVAINLEHGNSFEVFIRSVDGFRVRAQEGQKAAYHVFDLNPCLEEYEVAAFIVPEQNYVDDIERTFGLQFLQ